jgi:photosystem II stability/assembly factor-like uncharacterized protein
VWRSEDRGASWQAINRGILYLEMFSLTQNPASGALYAGTQPAAVFKSTNGGDSWTDCRTLRDLPTTIDWTFPRPPHVAHVKHLDVYGDRVMGAVEEGWVVRSTDAGATWSNIKDQVEFDCHTVTTLPDDPEGVIATSGVGFYRSEDGGASFSPSFTGLTAKYMANVALSPKRPSVLFTAAAEVPPPGWSRPNGAATQFFRSEDRGKSWRALSGGLPELVRPACRTVAADPDDPNAVFFGLTDGSVWMTEDGGESFRQIISGLKQITGIRVGQR